MNINWLLDLQINFQSIFEQAFVECKRNWTKTFAVIQNVAPRLLLRDHLVFEDFFERLIKQWTSRWKWWFVNIKDLDQILNRGVWNKPSASEILSYLDADSHKGMGSVFDLNAQNFFSA